MALSASRYQTEGGHMKLANVPTCPFPTYRVSQQQSGKWEKDRGGAQGDEGDKEKIRNVEGKSRRRIARG